jgi:hypothetical protein
VKLYSEAVMDGLQIVFLFGGEEYMVDTEYTWGYWEFTVEISESQDEPHGLKATFIHRNRYLGDDTWDLAIIKLPPM